MRFENTDLYFILANPSRFPWIFIDFFLQSVFRFVTLNFHRIRSICFTIKFMLHKRPPSEEQSTGKWNDNDLAEFLQPSFLHGSLTDAREYPPLNNLFGTVREFYVPNIDGFQISNLSPGLLLLLDIRSLVLDAFEKYIDLKTSVVRATIDFKFRIRIRGLSIVFSQCHDTQEIMFAVSSKVFIDYKTCEHFPLSKF